MPNINELPAAVLPFLPWIELGLQALAAIAAVIGAIFLLRAARKRPLPDVLTVVAASIATGVSAQGMWRFSGDVLGLDGPLRLLLFAFIEVAIITSAVRARRNMRENFSAGIDGIAVWALTALTAVLSSMDARSLPEALFRLAAPLVAAWLWERGMAIERHRIRGTGRINWRLTPERVMVRLGLAEARDRSTTEVDAHRRLTRVALAAKKAKALREGGAPERKMRAALAKLDKAMDQAVEHTGLADDEARQSALLARIDTLNSTAALAQRTRLARWADPTTQEDRDRAEAALDEVLRFDTAEATQRAIDRTAVTLMSLTERVTSQRVNEGVNNGINGYAIPDPREPEKLTFPLTPELTVEQVNAGLNFDVNDPEVYALERMVFVDPYVTPQLTPQLSPAPVNSEVNEDPESATKTQVMRDFWSSEVAADRYPAVKELADHAGVDPSLASRKRKEWVAELPWRQRRRADPKRDRAAT